MKIEKFEMEEIIHEDFVSRIDFINQTGVFCSPERFEMIYDDFVESGVKKDEFVHDYRGKYATCLLEVSVGDEIIYYELDDDILGAMDYPEDEIDFNVIELLNNIAMAYSHKHKYTDDMIMSYHEVAKSQTQIIQKLMGMIDDCVTRSREIIESIKEICAEANDIYGIRMNGEAENVHNPVISTDDLPVIRGN